jgi:hypothetical protein
MIVNYAFFRGNKKINIYSLTTPLQKNCWNALGVTPPNRLNADRATKSIKRQLLVPFAMDIIIIMCWVIWTERNTWIFNNEPPQVNRCLITFKKEPKLVIHRGKRRLVQSMEDWFFSIFGYV